MTEDKSVDIQYLSSYVDLVQQFLSLVKKSQTTDSSMNPPLVINNETQKQDQ